MKLLSGRNAITLLERLGELPQEVVPQRGREPIQVRLRGGRESVGQKRCEGLTRRKCLHPRDRALQWGGNLDDRVGILNKGMDVVLERRSIELLRFSGLPRPDGPAGIFS